MQTWKRKTIAIAATAIATISLAAAPAMAERLGGPTLDIRQGAPVGTIIGQGLDRTVQPQADVWHALGCNEVGNGDVATTVRLSNIYITDTIPAGNVVSIYGSDGQHVSDHVMPYALPPGAHVDVQVVPWQAVYEVCVAMTGL